MSDKPVKKTGWAKAGPGRPKGSTNVVTVDARKAIATFVNGNSHRLEHWLDLVANGQPEHDIKPNPAKAFELFQSVIEYHVPKLNRTEVQHTVANKVTELSDDALIMIATQQANVIEDATIKEEVRRE